MQSFDLHMHTTYCDGNSSAEEMILSAIEKGLSAVGISGHSFTPHDPSYCMSREGTLKYIEEIRALKEKYSDRITVLLGLEKDYYADTDMTPYDYWLGSLHYLFSDQAGKKYEEIDALHTELNTLQKALGEAKAKERLGEMNAAIAEFTDEEREYAKDEIAAFEADPINDEINSVVDKIWKGIGMKSKAEAAVVSEQNDAHDTPEDIFSGVELLNDEKEDTNIF